MHWTIDYILDLRVCQVKAICASLIRKVRRENDIRRRAMSTARSRPPASSGGFDFEGPPEDMAKIAQMRNELELRRAQRNGRKR